MGTTAPTGFDADTLRRAVEGENATVLLSLYADDAQIRLVNKDAQPSRPKVLHGRNEIAEVLNDVYSRDLKHRMEQCVIEGDHAAYSESCEYPDGLRVLSESMITLRDGKISEQIMIEAWDD
ncbi:nuclear transport factor 2 family protein [Streptomyces sp. MS06]|uniref:nuclear transport factor 2 family protein n=1 Tax=Streptomyces sp. MS06 TaxID=3385974 RepID=UPI0039A01AF3